MLIAAWSAAPAAGVARDDYAAVNLGQVKAAAKPFYDRLAAVGLRPAGSYPWSGVHADDHALANVGQLKTVFSFAVPMLLAPPASMLAGQSLIPAEVLTAAWRGWQSLPATQRSVGSSDYDFDGDGISNLQAYLMGRPLFDPNDIDGDRIPNAVEDLHPGILNKSRFADAVADYEADGVMNFEEIALGLDLTQASTVGRTDGLSDVEVLAAHLKATLPGSVREIALRTAWDTSLLWLAWYAYDDGLLTGHPEWQVEDDLDDNGEPDGWEAFLAAYTPPVLRVSSADCDGDAMPDLWEYRYQLDLRDGNNAGYDLYGPVWAPQPPVPPDPQNSTPEDHAVALAQYEADLAWYDQQHALMLLVDPDEDTLCNLREYYLGTNPRLADTNGDGVSDAAALAAGLDPSGGGVNQGSGALADEDLDGIPNLWEMQNGFDPRHSNADSDHDWDGISDADEYRYGGDPIDFNSRPLPVIEHREKSYAGTFDHYTWDPPYGLQTMFYGEARLFHGEVYKFISNFDEHGSPINNSPDRSAELRTAFETGGFENRDTDAPLYLFKPTSHYTTSNVRSGDTNAPNWSKSVGGRAMELRVLEPTFGTSFGEAWSRTYLVVEYSGSNDEYFQFSTLPMNTVLGSVTFSRTADGVKSVTASGDTSGQVKANGDRVEIIPREEVGKAIRIALLPVEVKQMRDNGDGTFGDFVAVSELRPTRWRNMFRNGNESFIDDPDQIKIRIPGLRSSQETFRLKLGVTGITGKSNSISKDEDDVVAAWQANDVEVPPQHLVTDSTDDNFSGRAEESTTQKDDYDGDRTHIVSLGATVELKIEGSESGDFPPIRIPVKGPDGKVEFRVFVLSPNGLGGGDQIDPISNEAKIAHEVYEQIGVSMDWLSTVTAPFPEGLPSSIPLNDSNHELTTDEVSTLVDLLPDPTDKSVIDVYYLPCKIKGFNGTASGSFVRSLKPGKGKYGVILISIGIRNTLTLAHELGHACNLAHLPDIHFWLMKEKGVIDFINIYNSKRFHWQEENIIKSNENAYYIPLD